MRRQVQPKLHDTFEKRDRTVVCVRSACHTLILSLATSHAFAATLSPPSQLPLINRADTKPGANVMLTLDDSGSMTYQYLPERPFSLTPDGPIINFPNDAKIFLNPRELRSNEFTGGANWADTFYVTAVPKVQTSTLSPAMKLIQEQMRSPQVNGMYYNPDVTYHPWITSGGTYFRTPDPTRAWLNPKVLDPSLSAPNPATNTDWVDLTQDITPSVNWYCDPDVGAPNYNNNACYKNYSPLLTFSPALLYLLPNGAAPNQIDSYQEINLNALVGDAITYTSGTSKRTDCGTPVAPAVLGQPVTCTKAQELQNYANWFVFYRSRLMAAQGAVPQAFSAMSDNIRVGWATIHSGSYTPDKNYDGTQVSTESSSIVQQSVRPLTDKHLANLTTWMRNLSTLPGTPTKDALYAVGEYFKRPDRYGPWATDPSTGTPATTTSQLGCRRNYNILITDGYYRTSTTALPANQANADNTKTTGYTPTDPFQDGNGSTLADFAMYYWSSDLRSDLSTDPQTQLPVLVPAAPTCDLQDPDQQKRLACIKSDTANWRHLSQFMVGFGVSGNVVTRDSATNDSRLWMLSNCHSANAALAKTDKLCWPDSVNEIDDLWHAAIDTRGAYFSVSQADKLAPALVSALTTASDSTASVAGAATASTELITDSNVAYVPEYQPVSWYGNMRAYSLDNAGNTIREIWNAAEQMPQPASRNIYVWDTVKKSAAPFVYSSDPNAKNVMTSRSQGLLGPNASENFVNYLRGQNNPLWTTFKQRSQPASNGAPLPSFILPDIVNSTPLFVQQGLDLKYSQLPASSGGGQPYTDYLATKNKRVNGLLLVGSNGGMLHAFNTSDSSTAVAKQGAEIFALVPEASLPNLAKIAQANYGSSSNYHQAFIDGPLVESDAYIQAKGDDSAGWHDVVVGTMGAGGRAVFALTLNNADPTQELNASSVLWEASSADMGYISSEPQIGVLPDGSWKVFVGNGADSPNHVTALLMIDMATGDVQSLPVSSTAAPTDHVGLGGVALVHDGMGQVVGAYAGDMQGHLWRFEWDTTNKAMAVGYKNQSLFTATAPNGTPQPITAAPLEIIHPTKRGQLIVVNTGRLLYTPDDSDDTGAQSAYGIWDEQNFSGSSTTGSNPPTLSRSNLLAQSIGGAIDAKTSVTTNGTATTQIQTFYTLTSNPINWAVDKGWVLDLVFPSSASTTGGNAKAIYPPISVVDTMALITGVLPAGSAESCSNDGSGEAIYVDLATGGKRLTMQLDTNGDGAFDAKDLSNAAGVRTKGGRGAVTWSRKVGVEGGKVSNFKCRYGVDGCVGGQDKDPNAPLTITDRVWRQLLNPPTP